MANDPHRDSDRPPIQLRFNSYRPPPPRPTPDSYRPSGLAPPPDRYQFHGQAAHHDAGRSRQYFGSSASSANMPQNQDFNFRSSIQGPEFERTFSDRASNGPAATGPRRFQAHRGSTHRGGTHRGGPNRGGFRPRGASDRVILRSKRQATPERLTGMQGGQSSFVALEDLSDSSEAGMELGSDADTDGGAVDADGNDQPAAKRARKDNDSAANSVPKWSNPDPYTSLPPPDESQNKKKDVVKLIRKAKVAGEEEQQAASLAADNADFISFNFDDEYDRRNTSSISDSPPSSPKVAGSKANETSSRQNFSHLNMLHPGRSAAASRPLPRHRRNTSSISGSPPRRNTSSISDSPPPPPQGKKRKHKEITGDVLQVWLPYGNVEDSTPWVGDYSMLKSGSARLHQEIQDFYDYVRPLDIEQRMRQDLISRIADKLTDMSPDGQLFSFGSFNAGIYLPTADMDVVFVSSSFLRSRVTIYDDKRWMFRTKDRLVKHGIARPYPEVIWKAKVPIIKFVDMVTNVHVDLSFENMTGVKANSTFQTWKEQFPVMPIMATLIKQFLLMRGLNEVFSGGIGGFTVTCLVTSFLKLSPTLHDGKMGRELNLGDLLLEFLDFYGNKFDLATTAIQMNPISYFQKNAEDVRTRATKLCIMDPNRPDNDISAGSSKVDLIFAEFAAAHAMLRAQMASLDGKSVKERRGMSILGSVFAGDYRSFGLQRRQLRKKFEQGR